MEINVSHRTLLACWLAEPGTFRDVKALEKKKEKEEIISLLIVFRRIK